MARRRTQWRGLGIVVENEAGTYREWKRPDGTPGRTLMRCPYGFFADHAGSDGDELDCYIGSDLSARFVYVVHQLTPDGKRDEDKCILDVASEAAAKALYLAHRDDGERAYGGMSSIPADDFIAKLSRRSGDGKIRHSVMQRLFSVAAFRFSLADPQSAIGKWSRIATFGAKQKDGASMVFDATTLGEMVTNAERRGDRIAICNDHASAYPESRDAPALGFFGALAVVAAGQVVKSWNGQPDPSGLDDGLYGRLDEVTPRGADPLVGLSNYRTLSPMFTDAGKGENGEAIGYSLFDVAATNVPFQAGAEIMFHRMNAPVSFAWSLDGIEVGDTVRVDNGDGDVAECVVVVKRAGGIGVKDLRTGRASYMQPGTNPRATVTKLSAPAAQAVTMSTGFKVDGEGPFSLADMERENGDDRALIAKLRAMKPGDVHHAGGGAAAGMKIEAVSMSATRGDGVQAMAMSPNDVRAGSVVSDDNGAFGPAGSKYKVKSVEGDGFTLTTGKHLTWAEAGRLTEVSFSLNPTTPGARRMNGAPAMDENLMQRMGLTPDATPEEKLSKYAAYAMGDATPDDLKAMADALDGDPDEKVKGMAAKFRKMAGVESPVVPAVMAHAEPDGDEAQAMSALSASLKARGVTVPANATRSVLMSLASMAPAAPDVSALVKAEIARLREQEAQAARDEEAKHLVAMARTAKAPDHEITALSIVAKSDLATARTMAQKYGAGTTAPPHLFNRLSAAGGPIGNPGDGSGAREFAGPKVPTVRKVGSMEISAPDEQEAAEIRALAFSAVPADVAKVDALIATPSERTMPHIRLMVAKRVLDASKSQ